MHTVLKLCDVQRAHCINQDKQLQLNQQPNNVIVTNKAEGIYLIVMNKLEGICVSITNKVEGTSITAQICDSNEPSKKNRRNGNKTSRKHRCDSKPIHTTRTEYSSYNLNP